MYDNTYNINNIIIYNNRENAALKPQVWGLAHARPKYYSYKFVFG